MRIGHEGAPRAPVPPANRADQLVATARIFAATSGRAMALPLAALFIGVMIPSAILFGGNGVSPRALLRWLDEDIGLRAALWVAWVALATPVLARALDARGTRILRTLPIARRVTSLGVLVVALTVQAPWTLLFAIGGGAWAAAAAASLSVTLQSSLLGGARRWRLASFLVASALVLGNAPFALSSLLGAGLAWSATGSAWRFAPERASSAVRLTRRGPAALLFVAAHLIQLVRGERGRLARSLGVLVLASLALLLTLKNNPPASLDVARSRLLVVGALPAVLVATSLADPIVSTGARLLWLARALGKTTRFARLATAATTLSLTAIAGLAFGLVAARYAGLGARSVATSVAWFAALGLSIHAIALREETRGDGSRRTIGSIVVCVLGWILAAESEAVALIGALVMTAIATTTIARRP